MKKIFIGTNNIASVFKDLSIGFNKLGIPTLTVSRFPNSSVIISKYEDFNMADWKRLAPRGRPNRLTIPVRTWWEKKVDKFFLDKAIRECDIFIFISESLREDLTDLEILKRLGKTIIFVFVGDDVRWYNAMKQEFDDYGMHPIQYDHPDIFTISTLKKRIHKVRTVEKYADFIFSRVDQAQLQIRPYYRWNMMVDPETIFCNAHQSVDVPVIAHAPSNRIFKGTKYILEAFERLKNEGLSFEVKLIENMANAEAVATYSKADILIDQLYCPGAGKVATEALAAGAIVLSNMSYDTYPQNNPADCPIIDVNPKNIYEKLKWLINDVTFRTEHAKKGRIYVEKYLDVQYFCRKVIDLTLSKEIEYDYYPSFFREEYIPSSKEEKAILNDCTADVSGEKWYKKNIASGKRDGLQF